MVTCCVPSCYTNSRKCDPAISFHEFPSEPDIVAKWIRNINTVVKNGGTWYPRDQDKQFICSKHFLPTDFKTGSEVPALKPRSVPTLFANILGFSSSCMNPPMKRQMYTHTPLIVKINKNSESDDVSSEPNRNTTESSPTMEDFDVGMENQLDSQQITTPVKRPTTVTAGQPTFVRCTSAAAGQSSSLIRPSTVVADLSLLAKPGDMYTGQSVLKKTPETSNSRKSIGLNNRKQSSDLELIEIGPNTFLKINPKVIKVAKKVTPSGNSVLQFIMNKAVSSKVAPEIITIDDSELGEVRGHRLSSKRTSEIPQRSSGRSNKSVDNVIGHLVDGHFDKEVSKVDGDDPNNAEPTEIVIGSDTDDRSSNSDVAESDCIQKAPVLLTAGVPVTQCLTTTQRLITKLKQKTRELKALRKKVSRLQARLESAENKCIVQERELSYAKVKKIKSIRKAAAKGDPTAVFILEQIKAFDGNPVMRWSDSTLRQCSIWCRKAPYAYEYFKKADLFKLPCLSTVKRFMKKCPLEQLQMTHSGQGSQGIDDVSSSDFNFDSSDDEEENAEHDKENVANGASGETRNAVPSEQDGAAVFTSSSRPGGVENQDATSSAEKGSHPVQNDQNDSAITSTTSDIINEDSSSNGLTVVQTTEAPVSEDQGAPHPSGLHVQEVVLPQGLVQCLNSKLGTGQSQYILIPALNDQTIMSDHQYSVLQSNNGPVIIQNVQNSQLSQEQVIFITHGAEDTVKTN